MRTAMGISPHADDAAAFCGATLAKLADQGWRIILVRGRGERSEKSVVMVIPCILRFFFSQRIFTQGIVMTGIKGWRLCRRK